jgi:hypothetical protein
MKRSARAPEAARASSAPVEARGSELDPRPDRWLQAALPSAGRENFLKSGLKSLLSRFDIYVLRMLPRGVSLSHDLREALPGESFDMIFDVGANVGQSTRRYLREFPNAHIVSFEP